MNHNIIIKQIYKYIIMNKNKIVPLSYQVSHIENIRKNMVTHGICVDNSKVGSGKMHTALLYAQKYKYQVFIIVEKNVITQWRELCNKMNIQVLGITSYVGLQTNSYYDKDNYLIKLGKQYNHNRKPGIAEFIVLENAKIPVLLIIDEIQKIKNVKTNMFNSIGNIFKLTNKKVHILITSATLCWNPTFQMKDYYYNIFDRCLKNNYYNTIPFYDFTHIYYAVMYYNYDRCPKVLNDEIKTNIKSKKIIKLNIKDINYLLFLIVCYDIEKCKTKELTIEKILLSMKSDFEKNTIHRLSKIKVEPNIYTGITLIHPLIDTVIRNIKDNRGVLIIYNTEFAKYAMDFVIGANYVHNWIKEICDEEKYDNKLTTDCVDLIFKFVGTDNLREILSIEIGNCVYNAIYNKEVNFQFYINKKKKNIDIPKCNLDDIITNIKNVVNFANNFNPIIYKKLINIILHVLENVKYGETIYGKIPRNLKKEYKIYKANINNLRSDYFKKECEEIKINNADYKLSIVSIHGTVWHININMVRYDGINGQNVIDVNNKNNRFKNFVNVRINGKPKFNTPNEIKYIFIVYTIYNNFVKDKYDMSFEIFNILYRCIDICVRNNYSIEKALQRLFSINGNKLTVEFTPVVCYDVYFGIDNDRTFIKSFNIKKNREDLSLRIKKYFYKTYKNIINSRNSMSEMKLINYSNVGKIKCDIRENKKGERNATTQEKDQMFKDFRNGNINLLISSSKYLSSGINLHDIDGKMPKTYILLPDKNIEVSVQAAGRIARACSKTDPIIESLLRYDLAGKICYDNELEKEINNINISNKFDIFEY